MKCHRNMENVVSVGTFGEKKCASTMHFVPRHIVTFKIVDKKIVKRTAMQEQVIYPLRAFNYVTRVDGKKNERTVFALPKFTIPDGKKLVVEMYEKQGGRHQSFEVENEDLVRAGTVNELKVR